MDILQQASKVGLDFWSGALLGNSEESFNRQLLQYSISTVLENASIDYKINNTYLKKVKKKYFDDKCLWINQSKFCFLKFDKNKELYIIFYSKQNELKDNFYKLMGQILTLKEDIDDEIRLYIISNRIFNDRQKRLLKRLEIEHQYYYGGTDE